MASLTYQQQAHNNEFFTINIVCLIMHNQMQLWSQLTPHTHSLARLLVKYDFYFLFFQLNYS